MEKTSSNPMTVILRKFSVEYSGMVYQYTGVLTEKGYHHPCVVGRSNGSYAEPRTAVGIVKVFA